MDIRLVFLLFIGTVIYFVYFYHGRRTNTKSTTKKKKKRHGKKQAAEPQENNSSTTQSHKIDSTTNKPANEETARSAVSSVAYSKQTHTSNTSVKSNDNVQVNIKAKEAATNQTEADSTSDAIDTSNTKRKNKKSSSHQQQKRNAQQQQFDADFPALPTKTYQEDNDMLPEEKSPVYARVLRITAPEKEKKEQISGARRQRAIAGPDGWFTVKTVAEGKRHTGSLEDMIVIILLQLL
jgi:FtsZ-interacting cell division protein ZipA